MLISLLTPTRERVDKCCRYLQSVVETSFNPEQIEALFYVDDDDPQVEEYQDWLPKLGGRLAKVEVVVGPFITVSKSWNELASRADGDVLCMGNDDLIYLKPSGILKGTFWDARLLNEMTVWEQRHGHAIWCMWFDDGMENCKKWPIFPMISRDYYESLGYFAPNVGFKFFCNDSWVGEVSKLANCQHFIAEPQYLLHYHWSKYPNEKDATTARARVNNAGGQVDINLLGKTLHIRQAHAAKLRQAMT